MVGVTGVKPPESVRGRPFPKRRSGRIRASQLLGEFPLQTRCRCSRSAYADNHKSQHRQVRIRRTIEPESR